MEFERQAGSHKFAEIGIIQTDMLLDDGGNAWSAITKHSHPVSITLLASSRSVVSPRRRQIARGFNQRKKRNWMISTVSFRLGKARRLKQRSPKLALNWNIVTRTQIRVILAVVWRTSFDGSRKFPLRFGASYVHT